MDGSNSNQGNQNNQNQGKQNTPQQNQQKQTLSWSQPSSNTAQNKPAQKTNTTSEPQEDSTGRVIGIIVGIIIVFALVAWGIVTLHKSGTTSTISTTTSEALTSDETSTTETPSTTATEPATNTATDEVTPSPAASTPASTPVVTAPAGSATFSVPSAQSAGSQVSVTDLSLSAPTWIVVYESADGVTPGRILGAGLFFAGDTTGTIQLLRATVSGKAYLVSAALDDGNKSFNKATEKFVTDASGAQVWMKFQTR